jgi:serine/threonine protein kinase
LSLGLELSSNLRDLGCGRQVGNYTLLRRIATGGMAEVYIARSRGLSGFERKVAIKKILPQHSHNERFVDMLVDEAKITVCLTHPNIAQVYELGLDGDDTYFIVMEYVDGRPLNRIMQRVDERGMMTIPIEAALYIMSEVAKGLDHAHKQKDARGFPMQIIHRDVSPQNVLISYQGDVKLIDFGIARAEGRIAQTNQGVIKGKLRYLAPEIAAGEEPDHRADVYCCGIVLFEMLTGEAMYAPKTDLEALEMASQARARSPRSRNPNVSEELDELVMKALRRDRGDRYQHAKDLHLELRRFLNEHYPAYAASDLSELMRQMFALEIEQEKDLDERADHMATESVDPSFEEDVTVRGKTEDLIASVREGKRAYKQLVTRVGIGEPIVQEVRLIGADGGHPMGIVLATDPPPTPRGSSGRRPATLAPTGRDEQITMESPAINPARIAEPEVIESAPDLSFEDQTMPPSRDSELHRALSRHDKSVSKLSSNAPWGWVFLAVAVAVVGASLLFAGISSSGKPIEIPAVPSADSHEPTSVDPISIEARPRTREPAKLTFKVSPDVSVQVEIDGRVRAKNARTPIFIPDVEPVRTHKIRIVAEGFVPQELTTNFKSGEDRQTDVKLRTESGTIVLKGTAPGTVISSHGHVDGTRIIEIPLETSVSVKVDRPGMQEWTREVEVIGTEPIELKVDPPVRLERGSVTITSRPISTIYVDGRRVGETPLSGLKLVPGRHQIMLVGPDGQRKVFKRTLRPGRPAKPILHVWHKW